MPRRIHVPVILPGATHVTLDPAEAHHVRDVLRLGSGEAVEAFDRAGQVWNARIGQCDSNAVTLALLEAQDMKKRGSLAIASAIPKGDRADWMIEKLSELGVDRFIPLAAARSVVLPAGASKMQRWERIAIESAKQSKRGGVMTIDPLIQVDSLLAQLQQRGEVSYLFSTDDNAAPATSFDFAEPALTLWIGPEGGWTPQELARFSQSGVKAVKLTDTVLRIETAAVAAAAVVAALRSVR